MLVLIGVGSNQGDPVANVSSALDRLRELAKSARLRRSSLWLTAPVDCPPDSPDFINAVAAFDAREDLTPETLLAALKRIEAEFGRSPARVRHAPRELDLDLLVFGDERRSSEDFTLPHPRATERRFVLAPAAEVAPDLVWPGVGQTVRELLASLRSSERIERLVVASPGARQPS